MFPVRERALSEPGAGGRRRPQLSLQAQKTIEIVAGTRHLGQPIQALCRDFWSALRSRTEYLVCVLVAAALLQRGSQSEQNRRALRGRYFVQEPAILLGRVRIALAFHQ